MFIGGFPVGFEETVIGAIVQGSGYSGTEQAGVLVRVAQTRPGGQRELACGSHLTKVENGSLLETGSGVVALVLGENKVLGVLGSFDELVVVKDFLTLVLGALSLRLRFLFLAA